MDGATVAMQASAAAATRCPGIRVMACCPIRIAASPSYLRRAAVDEELRASDEAGMIGGKEQRGLGNFVGLSDTAQRHLCGHVVQQALLLRGLGPRQADQARCPRRAGAEHVDADASPLEVEDPVAGEGADGCL